MGLSFVENKTYGFFHGLFKYFFFHYADAIFPMECLLMKIRKKKKKKLLTWRVNKYLKGREIYVKECNC